MKKRIFAAVLAAACMLSSFSFSAFAEETETVTLIPSESTGWKYAQDKTVSGNEYVDVTAEGWDAWVTDDAMAPAEWFEDAALPIGKKMEPLNTEVDSCGGIYLKNTFDIDASRVLSVTLNAVYDDGFMIYINGEQANVTNVKNIDWANVVNDTPAEAAVEIDPSLLHSGVNEIAVFVFNDRYGSSDIYFEMDMSAVQLPDNKSGNTNIISVTVDGIAAVRSDDVFTATANRDNYEVKVVLEDPKATYVYQNGQIIVTAENNTTKSYPLSVTVVKQDAQPKPQPQPAPSVPENGVKNGVLYKNSKKVTGTKVVSVGKKVYYVKNGKLQKGRKIVKYKNKLYAVNNGIVMTAKKTRIVKAGKKSYIVSRKGIVSHPKKGYKQYKVGKKKYIVNKSGVIQKNKKRIRIGKITYRTNKNGIVIKTMKK